MIENLGSVVATFFALKRFIDSPGDCQHELSVAGWWFKQLLWVCSSAAGLLSISAVLLPLSDGCADTLESKTLFLPFFLYYVQSMEEISLLTKEAYWYRLSIPFSRTQ
jgi:hypothetical protein